MAGEGGFEPPHAESESTVLPLDDSPTEEELGNNNTGAAIFQTVSTKTAAQAAKRRGDGRRPFPFPGVRSSQRGRG